MFGKRHKAKQMVLDDLKKGLERDEHMLALDELFERLVVDPDVGLSIADVGWRQERDGPNKLKSSKRLPSIVLFLKQLVKGFSLLLWGGFLLCMLAYGLSILYHDEKEEYMIVGVVLAAVQVVSAGFGYFQERKGSKIMETFLKMSARYTTVKREGKELSITPEELCIGDIVKMKAGDCVPADLRIIEANGFKVDNSPLTGESKPQLLTVDTVAEDFIEATNIAFFSTNAVEGKALGVVIYIGDNTVMGRIATLAAEIKPYRTPLAREINYFVWIITAISIIEGVVVVILAKVMNYAWLETIIFFVGIIVANVPEGLLITVSVCLTLAAKSMAKHNCLIKTLEAVETLGSTSVICTDKTGTLTQNRMTVSHIWIDKEVMEMDTSENRQAAIVEEPPKSMVILARTVSLCSNAEFIDDGPDVNIPVAKRATNGDASESALIKWIQLSFGNLEEIRSSYNRVFEIPFTSATKYHLCIYETYKKKLSNYLLVMKGAPEVILQACKTVLHKEEEKPLSGDYIDCCNEIQESLGGLGERVLAFCDYHLPAKHYPRGFQFTTEDMNFPETGYRFIGLVSLIDPPRASVPAAITQCQAAGIQIVMVTGDHPVTATAIAKKVGIISADSETIHYIAGEDNQNGSNGNPSDSNHETTDVEESQGHTAEDRYHSERKAIVIHGNELAKMSPETLISVLAEYKEIVFARTTPQQKLIVVEGFQRRGCIVAVTGDGVNDAPALKKADIGVAMGIAGTEVSKEAADLVLMDDNFASIVRGVEQGRIIFDNLKKSIFYTLTSKVSEVAPFLFFVVARAPLPLGPITILCIDLGTDLVPAISLAYEEAESDIMKRTPRDQYKEKLVSKQLLCMTYLQLGVLQALAGFFTYFVIMAEHGFLPSRLLNIHSQWYSEAINDLQDSYGQEWGYHDRMVLEYTCQTAFFVSIVVVQYATLIISKTRWNSLFRQGMRNTVLNLSLVIETAVAVIFVYVPAMKVLHLYPLKPLWWFCSIPYLILTLIYGIVITYFIRHYPGCWVEREFYY